ncbi:MAG: hypothetical protein J6Z43_08315 [Clostridiales bacterium]|nr:hypothetical protein [Clostridiales bacterium]
MGYGSYRASDWAKLKNSRGINDSSTVNNLFSKDLKEKYDPRFIECRESRDSADSPESTPIIIGFDVTGSMGYLAEDIAKNSLNKTITEIYDKQPVTNPHVMCAAFTSPKRAGALQVTQFEADIRVIEQLLDLKVNFGGNTYSYDDLVWYFALHHTEIDSFEKRGKKGFIFCIGDEICGYDDGDRLLTSELSTIFGDKWIENLGIKSILDDVSEKYEVFHIVTDMGMRFKRAYDTWENLMPGRVATIKQEKISYLSEVIISLMQLTRGKDHDSVIRQWSGDARHVVEQALDTIILS